MAITAQEKGIKQLFVPAENAPEATLAEQLTVYPVHTVGELVAHLKQTNLIAPQPVWQCENRPPDVLDFKDVKGQAQVKRALEIAAAGGHNILLVGPPGSGKSMLSKRLPSILPEMTREEALEVTKSIP